MKVLEDITSRFSDIPEELRLGIIKKYLIDDKLFARIQEKTKTTNKRCDLHYMLIPETDKMYKKLSGSGELVSYAGRDKWKYILVNEIPSTYEMRAEFLERCSRDGFKEIFKDRKEIEKAIESLDSYYEAILKKEIFPLMKLKSLGRSLAQYESKIKNLHPKTKKAHLQKALEGLLEILITREDF